MMSASKFDIFIVGVGGQGVGTLSELIIRAIDHAGGTCVGVDTHGLAQRGGVVSSHLRIGTAHSPLVTPGHVDLVIALERHEAMRGLSYVKAGGTLVYFDTSWQPLPVRLGWEAEVSSDEISTAARALNVVVHRVFQQLDDARMQNVAVLATVAKLRLIPNVEPEHYLRAMEDLMSERNFKVNSELFSRLLTSSHLT